MLISDCLALHNKCFIEGKENLKHFRPEFSKFQILIRQLATCMYVQ